MQMYSLWMTVLYLLRATYTVLYVTKCISLPVLLIYFVLNIFDARSRCCSLH